VDAQLESCYGHCVSRLCGLVDGPSAVACVSSALLVGSGKGSYQTKSVADANSAGAPANETQETIAQIDLHFQDLRYEADLGSWTPAGCVPRAHERDDDGPQLEREG
jgi:hypothetical protein